MPDRRWFRFEDDQLQRLFLEHLKSLNASYHVDDSGSVHFSGSENKVVMEAAHRVRDAQYRWYLLGTDTDELAAELRSSLETGNLRFIVELSDFGTWFLVPREDKSKHEEMLQRTADDANKRILAELMKEKNDA